MDDDLKRVQFKDTLSTIQKRVKELNKDNISLVDSLIESRRIEVQNEQDEPNCNIIIIR